MGHAAKQSLCEYFRLNAPHPGYGISEKSSGCQVAAAAISDEV